MARQKFLSPAALLLGVIPLGCVGAISNDGTSTQPPGFTGGETTGPGGSGPGAGGSGAGGSGAGGSGAGGAGGSGAGGAGAGGMVDQTAAGPNPLRRLDRREYNNTVRDLLGDNTRPADAFPSDHEDDFAFRRAGLVSTQDYSTVRDAAETLAAAAVKNITALAPCTGAEEACARTFATTFGLRAYRRPLVPAEVESLMTLYREARTGAMLDYAGGIRTMIEGILQSPAFLYHWENGPDKPLVEGRLVRHNPYAMASQLSYFLWGSMPDQALFDAASKNQLATPEQLQAQATRMLANERARDTVSQFVEEWLSLDMVLEKQKDPKEYPGYDDATKAALRQESRMFASNVVFDGDAKLGTLLTANYSFINQSLGSIYGMTATGADLKRTEMKAGERAGILTHGSFLAMTGSTNGSNPAKRGKKVFERLICQTLPPPPNDVPLPKPPSAGGTTRDRFEEHSNMACAKSCHDLLDPIGFAFEHYDGIGKYRTMDNGALVNASDDLELDNKRQSFKDATELAGILAASPMVQHCFATQWMRFAFKREETDADRASVQAAMQAFSKNGFNIRDLMAAVVSTRSFRYRAPAAGEILQ